MMEVVVVALTDAVKAICSKSLALGVLDLKSLK
jgi:hypothetical protein